MIRRCLLVLPLLLPVVARAQTPAFIPDFSKPDATAFVAPYAQNGGVAAPVRVEKEGNSLKMTSLAGGSFGVKLNVPPFDLDQLTRLSFDYTATPDAKVNIFFRVNGKYYAVLFTGPKRVRAGTTIVYDTHITKTSGHIEIPLRAAIRSQVPTEASLRLDEILVGNWDNDGYMMAGIGGNGPGAAWTVSNFKLEKSDVKPTFGVAHFEGDELVVPAQNLDTISFKNFPLKTSLGDLGATYDPLREAFVYDASMAFLKPASTAPEALRDGQSVAYTLRDDAGTVLNEGKATFRFEGLPVPAPPRLELNNPDDKYARIDFEDATVPFGMNRTPNTVFSRDSDNPYNGRWSACLTNPRTASPFDLPAGESTIDVAAHPVLTFAYRCDDRLRLDMNLSWNNQPYSIHFTDSDNPNPRLGDLGVVRDYQWHLAQFNVLEALKRAQPNATEFKISNLMWNDTGWPGNVKGLKWWLDDLKWASKTSGKLEAMAMLGDATGTSAISYILDQTPNTQVDEKAEGGPKMSVDLAGKTGLWWLHVRAQNGANKWSDTAHYPLWCG
ncbi:hypothetical protein IAD21_05182 [Abditibacteriota bacterium]|nr:hypothetical protein IAD21_05182 [Abditibacteriota bacterium]